jgi:hypothetical protein
MNVSRETHANKAYPYYFTGPAPGPSKRLRGTPGAPHIHPWYCSRGIGWWIQGIQNLLKTRNSGAVYPGFIRGRDDGRRTVYGFILELVF